VVSRLLRVAFFTSAATDVAATARAASALSGLVDIEAYLHDQVDNRRLLEIADNTDLCLVRVLGGKRAWPEGLDVLKEKSLTTGRPSHLVVVTGTGELDSSALELSTAPAEVVVAVNSYLSEGGPWNLAQAVRFLLAEVCGEAVEYRPPLRVPGCGIVELKDVGTYRGYGSPPEARVLSVKEWAVRRSVPEDNPTARAAEAGRGGGEPPCRPVVAVIFYRSHWLSGNMAFVEALCDSIAEAGGEPVAVFCDTLREGSETARTIADYLAGKVDAVVATVLAAGGSGAADAAELAAALGAPGELEWDPAVLRKLDVPVLQGLIVTSDRSRWEDSSQGLSPLDVAMQVAISEFDGRLVGIPFCFKSQRSSDWRTGRVYEPDPELCRHLARMAVAHGRLRSIPPSKRRLAIVLSNYPSKRSRLANAVALDTPKSAIALLHALQKAGYEVARIPPDGDSLMAELASLGVYDSDRCTAAELSKASANLSVDEYLSAYRELPADFRSEVERVWGPPPGDLFVHEGSFAIFGLDLGNVFVTIQPTRGYGENPVAIYHDPKLPPNHHYLATYFWIRHVFGADAIVHLGKHGTLEWLPGKAVGLSLSCAPQAVLGELPLLYPFVVNDPGEGAQAKRRSHATIIDHMIAPMQRAETYDSLAELEQLLDEYYHMQLLDPSKLEGISNRIVEVAKRANLDEDLGFAKAPEDMEEFVLAVDGYLCELKDSRIKGGLHVLGEVPPWERQRGTLLAILNGVGKSERLRAALANDLGLDEGDLMENPSRALGRPEVLRTRRLEALIAPMIEEGRQVDDTGTGRLPLRTPVTASDAIDWLEAGCEALLDLAKEWGWQADAAADAAESTVGVELPATRKALAFACQEVVPRLQGCSRELSMLLDGLSGKFIPPGPSGSPTRGLVNVLPTGRNFYTVDPRAIPSESAWEAGVLLAEDLIERYLREHGSYPRSVGLVAWGTSAMRTHGDDIAEALWLLGVRPVWDKPSRRVVALELVPLEELGRPRIDVVLRISGFFRDAFPNLISLFDDAVSMVVAAKEDPALNFPRAHVLATLFPNHDAPRYGERGIEGAERRDLSESGIGIDAVPEDELARASARVFGSPPGCYGAGLLQLIDAKNWSGVDDIAEVYSTWGGYAYGRLGWGVEAKGEMKREFARISVAVKNQDTREHDIFDSDDYFQYHGGMVATIRSLTGRAPAAILADSSDPSNPRTKSLKEEALKVFRTRVANPRWITAMMEHGYKGAFELAATVDYLFGYDAAADIASDWMYETLAEKYVLDSKVREFLERSNPWALGAIAERLLEAAHRGMWRSPDPGVLDELRNIVLWAEAREEEGRTE
jgi:cobaltochelatase CobN